MGTGSGRAWLLAAWTAAVLLCAGHAHAQRGVAFVPGTVGGGASYWGPGFIDAIRAGLADPSAFVVADCDFQQYAWTEPAAGCLASQLLGLIEERGVDELVVITHSQGGNVMRWILSNPTWDERYPAILERLSRVIALAPTSAGTPLADAVMSGGAFEQVLGALLGFQSDGVRMQQVAWMEYYNAEWLLGTPGRPELPVDFLTLTGTSVAADPFAPELCGSFDQNLALGYAQLWLEGCNDGLVPCASQQAAGEVWLEDWQATQAATPLSHDQSRCACFGLDGVLRTALASELGAADGEPAEMGSAEAGAAE